MSRSIVLGPWVLLVAWLAACGPPPEPQPAPHGSTRPATAAERYLPLMHDTVYSYATRIDPSNETGLLIMEITRPRAGRADLSVAGRIKRVEIAEDGIHYVSGGYLLKTPLELDASWQGRTGTVRVSDADRSVDVPAGHFDHCLETTEQSEGGTTMSRIVSVYCPGVGLVSLDIEAEDNHGFTREQAVLKSYGARIDVTQGGL